MSSSTLQTGIHSLRFQLAGQGRLDESDEELLSAFTLHRDDSAFAALVRRHGQMVLRVCRRVLGQEQDAEDAFQATFLVLARKAAALRNKTTLAGFLHGIAYRAALKAKQSATRRGKYESRAPARVSVNPAEEISWREVRALLDEEIARLPEKYQTVFVLCYLENLSQAEAARRLGLKERTLSSQLEAARKRLGQRLARRGVELSSLLAVAAWATPQASAVPGALMTNTIKAALATAASERLSSVASSAVAELVHDATAALMLSKTKIATVLVLAASMMTGIGVYFLASPQRQQGLPLLALRTGEQTAGSPRSAKREATQTVEIQGRVLDPDSKPVSGAKLFETRWTKAGPAFNPAGRLDLVGSTDAEGHFRLALHRPDQDLPNYLLAHAAGFGVTWVQLSEGQPPAEVMVRLVKDVPITGRIVNTEGRPIAGVSVSIAGIYVPANEKLDDYLKGGMRHLERKLNFDTPQQLLHTRLDSISGKVRTNEAGQFSIRGAGRERIVLVTISGGGVVHSTRRVITRPGFDAKPYNELVKAEVSAQNFPLQSASQNFLYPPDLTVIADAGKTVEGTIKDAASGKPILGCRVIGRTEAGDPVDEEVVSGPRGEYRLEGLTKNAQILVGPPKGSAYLFRIINAANPDRLTKTKFDIELAKGAIVTGRVVDKRSGKGVPCKVIRYLPLAGNRFYGTKPGFDTFRYYSEETDEDGRFRLVTIPGKVLVQACAPRLKLNGQDVSVYRGAVPDPDHKDLFMPIENQNLVSTTVDKWLVGTAEGDGIVERVPGVHNAVKVIDAKEDGETRVDLFVDRGRTARIMVQDADGKPLAGAWAAGLTDHWPITYKLPEATATVYALNPDKPRAIAFYHAEKKLGGTATVRGDEKKPVVVELTAVGKVLGRLIDGKGKPLAGVEVSVSAQSIIGHELYRFAAPTGKPVRTDKDGRFHIDCVVPNLQFTLELRQGRTSLVGEPPLVAQKLKPGETMDFGD